MFVELGLSHVVPVTVMLSTPPLQGTLVPCEGHSAKLRWGYHKATLDGRLEPVQEVLTRQTHSTVGLPLPAKHPVEIRAA